MNVYHRRLALRPSILLGLLIFVVSFQALAQSSPRLIFVEGGTFMQGSTEAPYSTTERVHETSLSSYFIAETETTQDLWTSIMHSNPSKFRGNDKPVETVSWLDAVRFCNSLSEAEGLQAAYTISGSNVSWDRSASGYRLPTEAEWEYAARGGNLGTSPDQPLSRALYAGGSDALEVGWFDRNSGKTTQNVAKKKANELNLYDMSGNVWEWCWDWYGNYPQTAVTDPDGAERGAGQKVMRGGAWFTPVNLLRVTYRYWNTQSFRVNSVGFRLARNANLPTTPESSPVTKVKSIDSINAPKLAEVNPTQPVQVKPAQVILSQADPFSIELAPGLKLDLFTFLAIPASELSR